MGPFEALAGPAVAALLLYHSVLRGQWSVALVPLVVVLTPVLGLFVAIGVAFLRYALLGRWGASSSPTPCMLSVAVESAVEGAAERLPRGPRLC